MAGAVVFGEVVSKIHRTWFPVDVELALFYAVAKPIETNVDWIQAIMSDGGVHDTVCGTHKRSEERRVDITSILLTCELTVVHCLFLDLDKNFLLVSGTWTWAGMATGKKLA